MTGRLHPEDIELIARRVVELLREDAPHADGPSSSRRAARTAPGAAPVLLTAAQVADQYGVSAEWVRRNRDKLGVVPLGGGKRPRLRFDAATVERALTASAQEKETELPESSAAKPNRRQVTARRASAGVELLSVRGFNGPSNSKSAGRRANAPGPGTRRSP